MNDFENQGNKSALKVRFLISMALNGDISWANLIPLMDDLTPTLEKSKKVNEILLKELETLHSKFNDRQLIPTEGIVQTEPKFFDIEDSNKGLRPEVEEENWILQESQSESEFSKEITDNQDVEVAMEDEIYDDGTSKKDDSMNKIIDFHVENSFENEFYTFVGDEEEDSIQEIERVKEKHSSILQNSLLENECETCNKIFETRKSLKT